MTPSHVLADRRHLWAFVLGSIALTVIGLIGLVRLELSTDLQASPVWPIALLIVGINGIIAICDRTRPKATRRACAAAPPDGPRPLRKVVGSPRS